MLNRVLAVLLTIICIGSIVYGYLHWTDKIGSPTRSVSKVIEADPSDNEKKIDSSTPSPLTLEEIQDKVSNLPSSVQGTFISSYKENQPVSILFVGSASMGTSESGWGALLREKLQEVYGQEFVKIELLPYIGTSEDFVSELDSMEVASKPYDIVLFEPFTLTDNGVYLVEENHENIMSVLETFEEVNPDVKLILQPPQPIFGADIYPRQVEDLAKFAEENSIPYVDHWTSWPDGEDEALKEYLDEESNPNEAGAEVWAEALIGYFVAE
ncbi:SGNH/GDSL hydrolase family protein [Rossellomorea sp. BNER]|uniref:SGNH/GDSL hydrolase family protein n=1 Tax=Rossellomorea sp. BNER TaxID=2962031 RepID=UPI003AF2FA25|nr:SGNH/GDSL hydrolase family protein [Rossellomorea sp. BNER]